MAVSTLASTRTFPIVRVIALVVVTLALNACGKSMSGAPKTFDFEYFESLPQSEILSSAQAFVQKRFSAGSDLKEVQNELMAAGAECARGEGRQGVYYECDYGKPVGITAPFAVIEWKIIIRPDTDEKRVVKISVNRGFTGL